MHDGADTHDTGEDTPTSDPSKHRRLQFGVLVTAIGAVCFIASMLPGIDLGNKWPGLFYAAGVSVLLPVLILPSRRRLLAGLSIPGMVLLMLGLIFTSIVITDNWDSWAYVWALIPASVGAGLWMAARLGSWGRIPEAVGRWMLVASLVAFAIFTTFLGGESLLARAAPLVLMASGVVATISSLLRTRSD